MRPSSSWIRWLAVILVSLTGVLGSYAVSTCHCGHEDAAAHGPDCCDTCDSVCTCHVNIVSWHPPAAPLATVRLHDVADIGFAQEGDLYAQLIYSPPRG